MLKNEPALLMGLIQAVVAAGLNLLMVFGFSLTADQVAAINGFVVVVLALGLSMYTRSLVAPMAHIESLKTYK